MLKLLRSLLRTALPIPYRPSRLLAFDQSDCLARRNIATLRQYL